MELPEWQFHYTIMQGKKKMNKPNILLILTDQQSANMMSCTGNRYLKTPYMDQLASDGIRFERAYCASPECLPSRTSMITGHYPGEFNIITNDSSSKAIIPDSVFTKGLGFLLKNTGYEAVYAGQQHFPFPAEKLGFDVLTKNERDELPHVCSDYINARRSKPFFMVSSFINPHDICYMAIYDFMPEEVRQKFGFNNNIAIGNVRNAMKIPEGITEDEFYDSLCPPLPDNFEAQENEPEAIAIHHNEANRYFKREARIHYTEKNWKLHRYAYCRLTELVDSQIGFLINALKESGQYDNTIIIFTADHGDLDSAHRLEHKELLYEESCRIPLIISPSKIPGRIESDHLVSNGLDTIKTILDYAEIDELNELKGQSLKPLAENLPEPKPRTFLKVECKMGKAVISKNYKYAVYNAGKNNRQLYDRQNDPGEMRNSINDADKQQILKDHIEAYERLTKQ